MILVTPMSQILSKAAIVVGGILVGAASTAFICFLRGTHSRESFEQRLRCKTLAETYAKKNSDEHTDVILSATARACLAASRLSMLAVLLPRLMEAKPHTARSTI